MPKFFYVMGAAYLVAQGVLEPLRSSTHESVEGLVPENSARDASNQTSQKIIQFFAQFSFLLILLIVPALDHRYGWSVVSPYVNAIGDVLIVAGFYIVFLVFKENTYASALIEVDTDQKVIATGPYAWVRHPMYIGAFILLLGMPLALGSWWGILAVVPITAAIVYRLLDEERFLAKNLPGYLEYEQKVRYRLVPFVW